MMRPPGQPGVVFTEASDGDIRGDERARSALCEHAGIPKQWATVHQVHGSDVVRVAKAGDGGDADAVWTTVPELPVAVFTADCFGVVLTSARAVGVAHAGWRGTRSKVVAGLRERMGDAGHDPQRAFVGPGIEPCCFEVGEEVSGQFPTRQSKTTWGTDSVDLLGALRDQLAGLDVWVAGKCTHHREGLLSHRRDGTRARMAAVGWIS